MVLVSVALSNMYLWNMQTCYLVFDYFAIAALIATSSIAFGSGFLLYSILLQIHDVFWTHSGCCVQLRHSQSLAYPIRVGSKQYFDNFRKNFSVLRKILNVKFSYHYDKGLCLKIVKVTVQCFLSNDRYFHISRQKVTLSWFGISLYAFALPYGFETWRIVSCSFWIYTTTRYWNLDSIRLDWLELRYAENIFCDCDYDCNK